MTVTITDDHCGILTDRGAVIEQGIVGGVGLGDGTGEGEGRGEGTGVGVGLGATPLRTPTGCPSLPNKPVASAAVAGK